MQNRRWAKMDAFFSHSHPLSGDPCETRPQARTAFVRAVETPIQKHANPAGGPMHAAENLAEESVRNEGQGMDYVTTVHTRPKFESNGGSHVWGQTLSNVVPPSGHHQLDRSWGDTVHYLHPKETSHSQAWGQMGTQAGAADKATGMPLFPSPSRRYHHCCFLDPSIAGADGHSAPILPPDLEEQNVAGK